MGEVRDERGEERGEDQMLQIQKREEKKEDS